MSACISSHGEYSSHTYESDDDLYCAWCGVGADDRLIAVTRRQVAEEIAKEAEARIISRDWEGPYGAGIVDGLTEAAQLARRVGDPS